MEKKRQLTWRRGEAGPTSENNRDTRTDAGTYVPPAHLPHPLVLVALILAIGGLLTAVAACGPAPSTSHRPSGTTPITGTGTCAPTTELHYDVQRVIDRDAPGFTEGFILDNGQLLESTGTYDKASVINRIDPGTGKVQQIAVTPDDAFGEGLTRAGNLYYQLTYRSKEVFVWDTSWNLVQKLVYPLTEGWGLTTFENYLVVSDGSDHLYFFTPDFAKPRITINVRDANNKTYGALNMLQTVGDTVYANVFLYDDILAIDVASGCVTGHLDMSPIYSYFTDAQRTAIKNNINLPLNGIAYEPSDNAFYVTGKNWPKIFKITIH